MAEMCERNSVAYVVYGASHIRLTTKFRLTYSNIPLAYIFFFTVNSKTKGLTYLAKVKVHSQISIMRFNY